MKKEIFPHKNAWRGAEHLVGVTGMAAALFLPACVQPARAAGIVSVTADGAKGDGQIASPNVTISAGSKALTVGTALFAASDVGKVLILAGAGSAPGSGPVETVAVASPGAGYTSVPSCSIKDTSGGGAGASCVALMSLQSVTVTAGGAGCVNGSQNFVVGIDASGTVAQVSATVSGGATTGSPTIAVRGLLSGLGVSSGAPGYGANCTTAPTFNLSYGVAAIQVTALGGSYSTTATTATLTGGAAGTAATLGVPMIGAVVPPLKTTIAGYTSPTAITLNDAAGTAISGVDQILWATNDYAAFQNALNAGSGILVPAGIYWIGGTLDPGVGSITITG